MVTRKWFLGLVLLLALQRILELRVSRRNENYMLAMGGRVHAAGQWRWMRLLHMAWFVSILAEVWGLRRQFRPWLAAAALAVFAAGQGLRYAAIRTLGRRWTVTVVTLPGFPPVRQGIYRSIRHPNYLGVALEILSVPLIHTAYLTAGLFSLLNGILLWKRIQAEEQALAQDNNFDEACRYLDRWRWPGRPGSRDRVRPPGSEHVDM